MGGRSLSVFPVAMSVLASFMSAITLLGTPVEVYRYGTQYIIINIAFCLVIPATAYLYLPVFFNLGVTSAYEVSIFDPCLLYTQVVYKFRKWHQVW
ncbi:Sodium-coupled monocarboxylate transporter 1 [Araneus ventricosus]|uniref:Sodium-coupled monocarboxylate transporter 1 n=1 Tax=Araneus ventricosus TaxID=182803 RepID=A0A4Y2IZA0_ARAVE|nr:Sodium-coupled monocarboxylate transporter 1 [Araneus ventricosus]